jgi:hypothetical protein
MALIDVCNGDADGLFAMVQLRLAEPAESLLVTGRKHEIALLERVHAGRGDHITVCDISIDRNAQPLARLLEAGATVRYFDHHSARQRFEHPGLSAFIDTDPAQCTSLIVDRYVGGRFSAWAAAAAWGDNLPASAEALAARQGFDRACCEALRTLGESVNYNAYGDQDDDCLIAPAALYRLLAQYRDPLDAVAAEPVLAALQERRCDDLAQALAQQPWRVDANGRIWLFPDSGWARRTTGPFANRMASDDPSRAHAVARHRADGAIDISVRAPITRRRGADRLCAAFGGGGRAAAAAIEALPATRFEAFVQAFSAFRWGGEPEPGQGSWGAAPPESSSR